MAESGRGGTERRLFISFRKQVWGRGCCRSPAAPRSGAPHRHGHGGARAHGEEEGVGGVCELGAVGGLHFAHRRQHVLPHALGQLAARLVKLLRAASMCCRGGQPEGTVLCT